MPVSVHHTLMLLCLMAWKAVCVCGVSCWITQEENVSSAIRSMKLSLLFVVLFLHPLGCFTKAHHLFHKTNLLCCNFFFFFTCTQNMFMHTHFHHILSLTKLEPWKLLSIAQIYQEHKTMNIQHHNEMIINNRQHFSWFPKCKFIFDQLNLMKSSVHHHSCGVILISLILFVHTISEKF